MNMYHMEKKPYCPQRNCDLMKLLPLLLDINTNEEINISPSQLMQELQISCEERLERLCRTTRKYRIFTEVNTFSRTPDIVVFQNFTAGMAYSTTLSLLNLHRVSRHIRVVMPASPFFRIKHVAGDNSAKVAPGMSYVLNITFLPLDTKDYNYKLTILTDGENFDIPLYALGHRPLLHLPDHVSLPSTALKLTSEKSIIVHNTDKEPFSYVISSKEPFGAIPSKDIIKPSTLTEIKIFCKPSSLGLMKGYLYFCYRDIKLKITVECDVESANIYLENDCIIFEEIFMGLKKQETIVIHNHSNHIIDFQWKLHKTHAIDQLKTTKLMRNFENIRELEKKRCNKLETLNIIDYAGHSRICDRSFEEEVKELDTNNLYLYKNSTFDIIPLTGKVLPKQALTFIIVFSPAKNEKYESWAYLDVKGRHDRLPLNLRGIGKGPHIVFNVKVLNINDVFLCAPHYYELVVKNEGSIPATVLFNENVTDFGGTITCDRKKVLLEQQDSCGAFIINFYSKIQGKFIERIEFIIKESEEVMHVIISGNVICPMLKLNIQEIDFGIVPFGSQRYQDILLTNDSQVPIDFYLKITDNQEMSFGIDDECKEIQFNPKAGNVNAYSYRTVQVQLTTNQVKNFSKLLNVNMWGSKAYSVSIPIKYNCMCPRITCIPDQVHIKFCFLNYECIRNIKLVNESIVPGFITYTPKNTSDDTSNILCTPNRKEFTIHPHEELDIELRIITTTLGPHKFPLIFTLSGSRPMELCTIVCNGQGPVVSYKPEELRFGHILLLQNTTKELTLMNDSPIPAKIKISTDAESKFQVDINEVEIDPEDEFIVPVNAYLTDTGKYTGVVNIIIEHGENIYINVFGEGVGFSIQCEPNLKPEYDAKTLLTYQEFVLPVVFTNMGMRTYQVKWSRHKTIKSLLSDKPAEIESHFTMVPNYFEILSNESKTFEIHGYSTVPEIVEEEYHCHALIGKASKMEIIMSFVMKAEFVEPSIGIIKPNLRLMLANECQFLEDNISFHNDTSVPLIISVQTSSDYYIMMDDQENSHIRQQIESKGVFVSKIKYAPNLDEKRYFKRDGEFTVNYENHPNQVKMVLSTEVCYPTIKLISEQCDFNCIPLNSYSYKKVIIQNITFLPVHYKWELMEYYEFEEIPKLEDENSGNFKISNLSDDSLCVPDLSLNPPEELPRSESERINNDIEQLDYIWNKDRYMGEMKKILLPIVGKFMEGTNDCDMTKCIKDRKNSNPYKIRDIITIEPSYGYLDPYEYGVAIIGFYPPPNMKIKAEAICKVEDGEQETLTISGISSRMAYTISKEYVEFGRRLFCEICVEDIILTNSGYCYFDFSIVCDDANVDKEFLKPGWLNVSPNVKSLPPGTAVTLRISLFPGITGEFERKFFIQIGYLKPVKITYHCYAVYSQIFLNLPRPAMQRVPVDVSYESISTISVGYLQSLEQINSDNIPKYRHVTGHPPDMSEGSYKQLKYDNWVIFSLNNIYPSKMDIDLSIERIQVRHHVMTYEGILKNHTFTRKIKPIPEFTTEEYILNFGPVIRERTVCYTVLLLNYGPIHTDVILLPQKNNTLDKNGFRIEFKNKKLEPGEIAELFVLFTPKLKRYPRLHSKVEDIFYITSRHGAIIPIVIKAVITLPSLVFEHPCVDFGAVKLGNCIRRSILMMNNGSVDSKWDAEIEMTEKRKKLVYFLRHSRGKLCPKKKQLIDIYFMPLTKGFKPAKLIIHIEGNSKDCLIRLCGFCTVSALVFNHTDLKFDSALPYSQDNNMNLMVQNVSTTPLEFSFVDFDQQYEEEELWCSIYLKYNYLRRVFIPQRSAGEKLHSVFRENYLSCLNELRQKMIHIHMSDADDMDTIEDPLVEFSHQEIMQLLNEYIETGRIGRRATKAAMRPQSVLFERESSFFLNTAIIEPESKEQIDPRGPRNAIFMIFHGGLNTEYLKAANRAGITLSIPVYRIDRLIYESLVENNVKSAQEINAILNNKFNEVAMENDLLPVPDEDEYDIITRKVYAILNNKPPKSKRGSAGDKKSKASDQSSEKKGKKEKDTDTLLDIPTDWFSDMLKLKLYTFTHGLIIESLTSDFLRKHIVALNCLLHGIGNAKYVHLIILSYNLQDYVREEEERLKEEARQKQILEKQLKEEKKKPEVGKILGSKRSENTQKSAKSNKTEKSSKKSEKSAKEKPVNYAKLILKSIPKPLKLQLEAFQLFLNEIIHICEFWDKRNCIFIKPFNSKPNNPSRSKSDTKSSARDLAKELKLSAKKRKSTLEDGIVISDIGVSLWLINNSHKERPIDFSEVICQSLKSSREIKIAKHDIKISLEEHLKESTVGFSIIKNIDKEHQITSDLFIISNGRAVPEKNDNDVFAICASSSTLEKNSEDQISTGTSSDTGEKKSAGFTPRCILNPEKIFQYEFGFYPTKCGLYNCNFDLKVIGLNLTYPIKCYGICELPKIDFTPETVFPRVLDSYRDKTLYDNFIYIKDERLFDFGLIILTKDAPLIYSTNLLLKNISRMCCEVVAELSDHSQYFLRTKEIKIEAGQQANLTVSIKVSKTDYIYSDLYISIKNNPKTEIIRLVTSPCKLEFSVKPKIIVFEKVPLNYTARRCITLTNASPISLQWKFVDVEWASEVYTISDTEDCLDPFSTSDVLFEYTTSKQEVQPKRNLEIRVFDRNHSTCIPVFTDFITLQADSVVYNLKYDDHINLGEILGKTEYKVNFDLRNEGICPVCVVFSIIDNPLDPQRFVRNCFQLKSQSEIEVNPNKSFQGTLLFNTIKAMDFTEVPILLCCVVEPSDKTNIVYTFTFKVSASVFLSSFVVCPASDIYFGYQQILSSKIQTMDIVNDGKFTFNYTIVSLKQDQQAKLKSGKGKGKGGSKGSNKGKGKGGSKGSSKGKGKGGSKGTSKASKASTKKSKSKSTKSTKSKKSENKSKKSKDSKTKEKKKIKITKLNVDGFSIISSTGEVGPGETVQVQIECIPLVEKEYSEVIILYVSNPHKKDVSGRHITLHATGSESHLNFSDFSKIFKEQFVVDKMENFIKPKNIGSHQVFVSSETMLHFKNVCINTTNVTKIYLENTGHVQARVTALVADPIRKIFTVFPNVFDIIPYNTESLTITFTPDSIQEFENKLEITYNSSKCNKFVLSLSGEGVIPQITLLEPKIEENNQSTIEFIPTYIGHTRSETISIRNIGLIFCKVIIEICENFQEMFSLVAYDDTFDFLNINNLEAFQNTKYSTLVNLQPSETANFNLIFKPTSEQSVNMEIKIHTVNNPFEIIKLNVSAQSFYHDICLELTPCNQKVISNSSLKLNTNCVGYHIDFGFSTLNSLQKKYFTIRNSNEKDVYRFEFVTISGLTFLPRVGHLKPLATKDIIVTFSTRKPLYCDKTMVPCNLNKIEYMYEEVIEELSWDDRQRFVTWESPSAKSSEEGASGIIRSFEIIDENTENGEPDSTCRNTDNRLEPDIFLIPEAADMIPLFFTIIADYSTYRCMISGIDFPDTFIRMKHEIKFDVENNGLIPLDITWEFCNNEIIRTRSVSANNSCTKNVPSSDSGNDTVRSSASSTTLFSTDSCTCSLDAIFPFTISPQKVSVYPNKHQTFSVYFEPINMAQYCARLKSNISGLDPKYQNMNLKVTGTTCLPVCYFDIEESDYLNRRPEAVRNFENNVDTNMKIIEFETVGIGVSTKKTFNIINPTEEIISYKFESLEEDQLFSYFACKTKSGFIMGEKQVEIEFTFKSQELGNFEEFYMCHIPEKHFRMQFLLAGHCRQPIVYFTKSYVILEPTVLTSKVTGTAILRNEEDEELSFKFLKGSLFSENHDQQLEVFPVCGKICPNTDLPIRITYSGQQTGKANFYLKCAIEKVKVALSLNVTTICVEVLSRVTYTDRDGKTLLLEKDKENMIDVGNVTVQQNEIMQFTISNIGETGFFYTCNFNRKPVEHLYDISIDHEKDFVHSKTESIAKMSLKALKYATLQMFKTKINISYGPTYILSINAKAEKPVYSFSFNDYDFGYCIVQKEKSNYYDVVLEFKNSGKKRLTLENCFENSKHLTVDFKSAQVSPSSSQNIMIFFHPLKVCKYKIIVPFTINSVKSVITISGEAVNINLQTVDVSDRFIDLGPVIIGTLKRYMFQVINRTPTQVNAFFDLWENLPIHKRPREKIEPDIKVPEIPPPQKKGRKKSRDKKSKKGSKGSSKSRGSKKSKKGKDKKSKKKNVSKSSKSGKSSKSSKSKGKKKGKKKKKEPPTPEVTEEPPEPPKKTIFDFLKIFPNDSIQLEPNKKCEVVIEFCPEEQLEDFSLQIFYECQDHAEPLCKVKGSCIAPQFSLANEYLSFANIVVGCRHSLSVLLMNTGDITGRFKWVLERKEDAFKINPEEGFIPPASEMKIWFSFEPKIVQCLFEVKAKCVIEGVNKVLELRLLGNSVKIPKPIATLHFTCPVRETTAQDVSILNRTSNTWDIFPLVLTDQFSVQEEIIIDPQSEYPLQITYCPKQMTKSEDHTAMLLLPLPEGQAMLYELVGKTQPPLPINKIEIEIYCKKDHTELLQIKNWLNTEQCFKVKTELTSTVTKQTLYKVFGNDVVELLPNDTKGYKWSIHVINEIPLNFKVMFINVDTEEYMFYEISVKVLPSGPLETIKLITRVRELGKTTIKLKNPIDIPIVFQVDIDVATPELIFDKLVPLDPYSTYDLDIQYCPVSSNTINATIRATCAELGTFTYYLSVIVSPPKPENVVKFKTELGDMASKTVRFENNANTACELFAQFEHPDFSMDKVGLVSSSSTCKITFNFEPFNLGILTSKVIITSTTTGNYIYPLIGECILPRPKGPFLVKPGGSTSINFVNPYTDTRTFNCVLDTDTFLLKSYTETIKSKKSTKIIVYMQPGKNYESNAKKYSITGKLIVTSEDDGVQWVYYIQGEN